MIALPTGGILGIWALIIAVTVGAVTTWGTNARRLLQIEEEILGEYPKRPSWNAEQVDAVHVDAGDWVYPCDKYDAMIAEADSKRRRSKLSGDANCRAGWYAACGGYPE
jgi:hypothetical protein